MTPLEHALNEIDLEEIKKECNPSETVEIKIYWQLEDLDKLGRPIYHAKKRKENERTN